ncbi:arylsulfatase [Haloferula chungangensis]|uniref:Arylsulfatase n=1 Tax=Haloferula chungangensis TaxID=1048331 RepID=A0ABW2L290_9BACT
MNIVFHRQILAVFLLCQALVSGAPNVILIVTDDQGYGDMGCHGHPLLKTPNLDRLHDEGVRLADYHVDPMCAPTRAALMMGRYAARTGVWSTLNGCYIPRSDEQSMAAIFKAGGYRTGMFGKWHLGDTFPYAAEHRGFEHVVRHEAGVVGEIPDWWNNDYFDDHYLVNGEWRAFEGYCTDVFFDEAMGFIGKADKRPFFCYLATNAVHSPFNVPAGDAAPYLAADQPEMRARFQGMVANFDRNLGRLMDFLDEKSLTEDTILIFMGDNGSSHGFDLGPDGVVTDGFNAGMRGKKTWVYDGGHRNACFIRHPKSGVTGGREVRGVTAHVDLLPTLIEWCALPKARNPLDGVSLLPQLKGDAVKAPERMMVVQNMQVVKPIKYKDFAVLDDRWRLVSRGRDGKPHAQLFNLDEDPEQVKDVAAQHPERIQTMLAAYDDWWEEMQPSYARVAAFVIGSDEENPVRLTAHSWRSDQRDLCYDQDHIRQGVKISDAYWPVEVEKAGRYRIELRRWPKEADTAIRAGLPAIVEGKGKRLTDARPAGLALPISQARLRIGGHDLSEQVTPSDKVIRFEVDLKKGPARLQADMIADDGQIWGAYYVLLERLGS